MCFGPSARRIWPRGFPLELVKHKHVSALGFGEFSGASVGVVQSLADQDPDVDAVYRLTMDLPVHFSNASSTLVLANGVFSPFNAQATLHIGTAFWGLYLPVSVHGRASDSGRAGPHCSQIGLSSCTWSCTSASSCIWRTWGSSSCGRRRC